MNNLPNLKKEINKIYQISRGNNNNIFSKIVFSKSGKHSLYSDDEKNVRKNYINVATVKYKNENLVEENKAVINNKDIQILGKTFVRNNKKKCKIIYNNKYYKLNQDLSNDMIQKKNNILKIKYKNISIDNMTRMFDNCNLVIDICFSNWNTNNILDMSFLFNFCESLKTIKGIENFNTSKVKNMEYMFNYII